jgi:SAM-dependent methyltransferase
LAEFTGGEFTGERVIPELVDADLLNEHLARYRFARHFVSGLGEAARILDAGCGTGYGTAELALAGVASVTGTDIAAEAVGHARSRYGSERVRFVQGSCETLPFSEGAFDVLVAFEVIEHLDRWQDLLLEAKRVLKSDGLLLVSTPNRDYYAESRGESGPNPFHRHEFDYAEFGAALNAVYPHVRIWTQNHAEAIVFAPSDAAASGFAPRNPTAALTESASAGDPAGAHFYLAACSQSPIAANDVFAWIPTSANVLREREFHIAKLEGELEKKDAWLRQTLEAHSELQSRHEELTAEMERQNTWAAELDREISLRNVRIADLQGEVEMRLTWIRDLEAQLGGAQTEIGRLNAESTRLTQEAGAEIARLQAEAAERTLWTQRLDAEIAGYREELRRIRGSRWFRAGKTLGLGPQVRDLK